MANAADNRSTRRYFTPAIWALGEKPGLPSGLMGDPISSIAKADGVAWGQSAGLAADGPGKRSGIGIGVMALAASQGETKCPTWATPAKASIGNGPTWATPAKANGVPLPLRMAGEYLRRLRRSSA